MRWCRYFDVESTGRYVRLTLQSSEELTVAELEKFLESMPMGYLSYYYLGVGEWRNGHGYEEDFAEEFVDCGVYDSPAQVCGVVTSDWLGKTVVKFEVCMTMETNYRSGV